MAFKVLPRIHMQLLGPNQLVGRNGSLHIPLGSQYLQFHGGLSDGLLESFGLLGLGSPLGIVECRLLLQRVGPGGQVIHKEVLRGCVCVCVHIWV